MYIMIELGEVSGIRLITRLSLNLFSYLLSIESNFIYNVTLLIRDNETYHIHSNLELTIPLKISLGNCCCLCQLK